MMKMAKISRIFILLTVVNADVYMHNPRGSNNRLDEAKRERNNPNRLFDSQNNNRGGYNVGSLYYYAGSMLSVEWTNQHSCGDKNSHCEIILQYMCGDLVRDGTTTQTIPDNPVQCKNYNCNNDKTFGMHEDYNYYKTCSYRNRNKGLFTADMKLNRKSARSTRQNPGGTRRGYECPEERDYYPYWHPSPWKDIAVMTNDATRCPFYERESENVKGRYECLLPQEYLQSKNYRNYVIPNNKDDCLKVTYTYYSATSPNATTVQAKWVQRPSHNLPPPECRETDWSRDNHLGNGIGGFPNTFNWTLPDINHENCVLRIRYNISTGEFNGWDSSVNASLNSRPITKLDVASRFGLDEDEAKDRGYVYKQNPEVEIFGEDGGDFGLRLAINTNQFGRVFQDRSHTFAIRSRPANIVGRTVHNLNVRGKRGNIVQVYPAVEYDFVPNRMNMRNGDYIHFQWTGSNTNPNNNDGQGKAGTDRNNVVLLRDPQVTTIQSGTYGHWGNNYPKHLDNSELLGLSRQDLQHLSILDNVQYGGEMSELDDAGTYFDLGPRKVTSNGIYHYMCSRNNNFSNRGQKGKIVVGDTAVAVKKIGWNGGNLTVGESNVQGVWVDRDTFQGLKIISLEEWSKSDGESRVKEMGASVDVGDSYASNFLVINPQEKLTKEDKKFSVTLKVDSSMTGTVSVYKSDKNNQRWRKIPADINDGVATMQVDSGGIIVARSSENVGLIVGVVIAAVIVVVIIIGTTVYFRKHPEKWTRTRRAFTNCHRSLQRTV